MNRLFYKVLDQNTIIIVPESRQKRRTYDELLLRTFYLQNAEVNETVNLVKTLAKVADGGRQRRARRDHACSAPPTSWRWPSGSSSPTTRRAAR